MSFASEAEELASATRLFVARHEEALLAGDPKRVTESCDGLHHGLCATLATELARIHHAAGESPRAALAYASATKRLAETEGVLMHLKLTLARGDDGPAGALWWRRLVGETLLASRCIEALAGAVDAWALALGAKVESRIAPPRHAMRAAREALLLGVPEAALAAIRVALRESGAGGEALARAAAAAQPDMVETWRLFDAVEHAIGVQGMVPPNLRA